ncbi:MAG: 4Fe-4S binding protein [Coriobacteriaceae bacterium]|nr:4Fe-4S binding protein [Coriobacteriaceae bacterium]
MAVKVSDECIACGTCEASCPTGAITVEGDKAVVDEDECVECGACVSECPTEALSI